MEKLYAWLILLVLPLSLRAGDTLSTHATPPSRFKFEAALSADLSQTGYSTALLGIVRTGKFGFAAGPKLVISKTYMIPGAPAGFVSGLYFYPNGDANRFTPFINIDYQLARNNGKASEGPATTVHEYTAGYGFNFRIHNRVKLLSSLNVGRYTEVYYNSAFDQRNTYSGFNTLVRFGLNYSIRP
jgi:hypothetical protein